MSTEAAACRTLLLILVLFSCTTRAAHTTNVGTVDAVSELISRVLPPTASPHFVLTLKESGDTRGFALADLPDGSLAVTASSASELASGVGFYLREYCNMTLGWARGGGSNIFMPSSWPKVGDAGLVKRRNTPWSYIMNVCTHSYSLVWYSWQDWEAFIDWMALSGINLFLAMTGQEEVQYKVFQKFGLNDTQIRYWFNGPAFLTWSRGQNEYGAKIAGPLPRSWMKGQWQLQRQIVKRYRSLGMSAQLPAFQGNVPIALKDVTGDKNMTRAGATGWMNSVDPLYGKLADAWMQQLVKDFGTDHWYQLDGYFNGGTAPWLEGSPEGAPPSLKGSLQGSTESLPAAGIDDASWFARGAAAYQGLNRTDPEAIWSFQGWAFVGWSSAQQATSLRSFIDATPQGKFNVVDMSVNGDGEWKKWGNSSFWGANFIWTTLHDFGGTDGLKGWLGRINEIPFGALAQPQGSNVWGTGFTPEGIDQNPVYYEFMLDANWRTAPVPNITEHIVLRSHRRYGLSEPNPDVARAWALLVSSSYSQDLSVQDGTGVPHLGGHEAWAWEQDRHTPSATLCHVHSAWMHLIAAADVVSPSNEPFRYDLVNTGREVLAQLAGPAGQNFTDATGSTKNHTLDPEAIAGVGGIYYEVLEDLDALVGTDKAFLLGPWLSMAKRFAASYGAEDCIDTGYESITDCARFYEWNARVQLTTWNPTPKGAAKIPAGPIDYASKHWSGLVKDYYGKRIQLVTAQAIKDAQAGRKLNTTAVDRIEAEHAYVWTTATGLYPEEPVGDPVSLSKVMAAKYASFFSTCQA